MRVSCCDLAFATWHRRVLRRVFFDAHIGARTAEASARAACSTRRVLLVAVATDAQAYWENHLPGPAPLDRHGPLITILASMAPAGAADGTYHFVDDNYRAGRVNAPNGHIIYENP